MSMKATKRYVHAKRVRYKGRHKAGTVFPAIDDLLRQIATAAPTWAARHHPIPPPTGTAIDPGTACAFLYKVAPRSGSDGRGVYFEIGSYVHGLAHDQVTLDFTQAEPPLETSQLETAGGHARAIANVIRGVALGETIILESSRGSGGFGTAERLLGRLIQRYCGRPTAPGELPQMWPAIELMDVMSNDLKVEIKRGGGVKRVYMRVADGSPAEDTSWAHRLRSEKDAFGHAAKFHAIWEGDEFGLDTEQVLSAVDEFMDEETSLDKLTLELKNNNRIVKLGRYKVREEIDVLINPYGKIFSPSIIDGLWKFLDDLRVYNSDGWRLIDDHGKFTSHAAISFESKKT